MASELAYKRLPGRRWGGIRRASLWDAGDHLLAISGTVFAEQYRRFYYREIKAIVVQNGPRLGSGTALLALLFLTISLAAAFDQVPRPPSLHFLWIVPLCWLGALIYISVAKSCRVFIYTSVSSEEVPALFRQSKAKKALAFILDKITASQGELSDEERPPIATDDSLASPPQRQSAPVTPQALFGALFFFAIVSCNAAFAFWVRTPPLTPNTFLAVKILILLLNALLVASAIFSLLKLANVRVLTTVRAFVIVGLLETTLRWYAYLILFPGFRLTKNRLTETMVEVHGRQWFGTLDCAACTIIAVVGLIALMMAWQNDQRGLQSTL